MFEEIYREIAYKPIDKMSKRELDLFNLFLENLSIQYRLHHVISAINAGMPITEEDIKEYLGISNKVKVKGHRADPHNKSE